MRGLVSQTWKNLEIIIVDDCSSDDTFAISESIARQDPRIVLMRHAENKGAYSARNTGLSIATGDLITVHDADDWAHPQKLYLQVGALKVATSNFANYTDWCRASSNLYFTGSHRPPGLVRANKSSTLLRKEIFYQYGGWDNVRISADNEFILRISKHSPDQHIHTVLPSVPLSFALDSDASLTREQSYSRQNT